MFAANWTLIDNRIQKLMKADRSLEDTHDIAFIYEHTARLWARCTWWGLQHFLGPVALICLCNTSLSLHNFLKHAKLLWACSTSSLLWTCWTSLRLQLLFASCLEAALQYYCWPNTPILPVNKTLTRACLSPVHITCGDRAMSSKRITEKTSHWAAADLDWYFF